MNWITDNIPQWNSWMALFLYWIPLVLCAYGYSMQSFQDYRKELFVRSSSEVNPYVYFNPELTIGVLVGRAVMTIIPVGNLFAALFDVAPKVFADFFNWIGDVLDTPLVPKRKVKEKAE